MAPFLPKGGRGLPFDLCFSRTNMPTTCCRLFLNQAKKLAQVQLGKVIESQLMTLADVADLNKATRAHLRNAFLILTAESLQQSPTPPFKGLSRINPNGLPFQWSFCLNNAKPTVRLVCEAGEPGTSAYTRYKLSLQKLHTLCHMLDKPYPSWLTNVVIKEVMPEIDDWPEGWESALWFAVAATDNQLYLKIYLNLNRSAPLDRWRRVGRVLQGLGRHESLKTLCELSEKVSHESWPSGLAIDILPNGEPGRIKTYFHSGEVNHSWLDNWYHALKADDQLPHIKQMLELFPQPYAGLYPAKAFFVSLEFGNDSSVSLKTDLTVSRWIPRDDIIIPATYCFAEYLGLNTSMYQKALKAIGLWPATSACPISHHLVGFGYEPDGSRHINVYCEPPLQEIKAKCSYNMN